MGLLDIVEFSERISTPLSNAEFPVRGLGERVEETSTDLYTPPRSPSESESEAGASE